MTEEDPYDTLIAEARSGCCDERRKPCERHDAYGDGAETMQRTLDPELDALRALLREAGERIGHDCGGWAWSLPPAECLTCRIAAALSATPAEPGPTVDHGSADRLADVAVRVAALVDAPDADVVPPAPGAAENQHEADHPRRLPTVAEFARLEAADLRVVACPSLVQHEPHEWSGRVFWGSPRLECPGIAPATPAEPPGQPVASGFDTDIDQDEARASSRRVQEAVRPIIEANERARRAALSDAGSYVVGSATPAEDGETGLPAGVTPINPDLINPDADWSLAPYVFVPHGWEALTPADRNDLSGALAWRTHDTWTEPRFCRPVTAPVPTAAPAEGPGEVEALRLAGERLTAATSAYDDLADPPDLVARAEWLTAIGILRFRVDQFLAAAPAVPGDEDERVTLPKGITCGECGETMNVADLIPRLARYIERNKGLPACDPSMCSGGPVHHPDCARLAAQVARSAARPVPAVPQETDR